MYNDLLWDRISVLEDDERDERIDELIEEIEELNSLLSPEAQELIHSLRPHIVTDDVYEEIDRTDTFGDRVADHMAIFAGSWAFILTFGFIMLLWMGANALLATSAWDPYPFILLNLTLSTLAALQAPVILMSQNRQAEKDRATAENDYQVNIKNEIEIADLHRKIDNLTDAITIQKQMINALVVARRQELNATVRAMTVHRDESNTGFVGK